MDIRLLPECASILSLPYVVRVKMLSQLALSEHLMLRRVCKAMKEWIDYSSLVNHLPVTIIRDYGSKTFTKFLEKRAPYIIKEFYIENDSTDFLNDPALPYFLHLHSTSVTKLRMKRFFTCKTEKEMNFYERFTNLVELELEKISIPTESQIMSTFPSNFKNLKVLKIGHVKAYPEPPDDAFGATLIPLDLQRPMGKYCWNLIHFCQKIDFLGYPDIAKYFFQAFVDGRGRGEQGMFYDYIQNRSSQHPNTPNLKFCDFKNDNWPPDSKNALALLKLGNEYGIKYLNVNANQFQFVKIDSLIRMYDLPKNTGDCIRSLKKFNCLITECLPSVDKLHMSASNVNAMLDYSCVFNGPNVFPHLKEIEIVVDVGLSECGLEDSDTDAYRRVREFRDVHILLSHFFYDMEMILMDEDDKNVRLYNEVSSLTIAFPPLPLRTQRKASPKDLPLKWIIKALPNLRRLKIFGWKVEPDTYAALWGGFPYLEELIIEDCESLTDACFNGESDGESVAFQNLKELQRITIRGLSILHCQLSQNTFHKTFEEAMGLYPSKILNGNNKDCQSYCMSWTRVREL